MVKFSQMDNKTKSFTNFLLLKEEKTVSINVIMELKFERYTLSQIYPNKEPDLFIPEIAENFISYIGEIYNQTILFSV
ncbi:MAG: hypothetical protein HeimC3_06610 [Candidatus Heimdallarchaeota archaeon LC_3]|nr:MAG: hypothetical protein HeimC3_06610 [Candidatus Heimdallarchaeota archaeon LC_3]